MRPTVHPPLLLQARVGQPLHFELDAAPAAGLLWQMPAVPAGSTLQETARQPAGAGDGAAARQRFIFTPDQPGEQTLRFELCRPWDSKPHAVQPVTVQIR